MKAVALAIVAAFLGSAASQASAEAISMGTPAGAGVSQEAATADVAAPPSPPSSTPSGPRQVTVPVRTVVLLKLDQPVGSKISKIGDMFPLELAEPLTKDGVILLPAKLGGQGEIVHAAKANWGGKPGELIIAARFLQCGERRIPLGHLHFSETGRSNTGAAFVAASVALPAMFLVSGKDIAVPAGTVVSAQITADFALSAVGEQSCPLPVVAPAPDSAPVAH